MNDLTFHSPSCECEYHAELRLVQALSDLSHALMVEVRR
jgi:hypothetical protein